MAADLSGTITLGGTAQALGSTSAPVLANRRGLSIRNNSAGSLWVNDLGTAAATQPSLEIRAGEYFEWPYPPMVAVSIFGATTGQSFTAREW